MHNAVDIAQILVDKAKEVGTDDMTLLKLIKMVYIAHGWMLGIFDRPLVKERILAWKYGPAIPELYSAIKHYRNQPIDIVENAKLIEIDSDEKTIIDSVFEAYNRYDGLRLSAMTHRPETPWDQIYKKYGSYAIPNNLIGEYYKNLRKNNNQKNKAK